MKVGILGLGEIGKAIYQLYPKGTEVLFKDLDHDYFEQGMDVMHVCIPYSDDFRDIVKTNQSDYKPKLTIVHSTVPVGTTQHLGDYGDTVHAPVRGVHPNLVEGLKTFVMYIGYEDKEIAIKAESMLAKLGIDTVIVKDSRHTELAKLLSTTYYALCISLHAYANRLCNSEGLDFDNVMTNWTDTYNEGYTQLGMESVVRPTLYPPKDDIIGGHCILQNAKMLQDQFGEDEILDAILRHK